MKSRAELYTLLPPNPIVAELGCAECYFSRDILDYWKAGKLYMVDNWGKIEGQTGDGNFENDWHKKNFDAGMERIKPFKDRAVILRGISWEMAANVQDESLDCLYIDCCHEYGCVKKDLEAWYPKLKKGGICAGHDVRNTMYGVERAVYEFTNQLGVAYEIIPENGPDASFYFVKP